VEWNGNGVEWSGMEWSGMKWSGVSPNVFPRFWGVGHGHICEATSLPITYDLC
jgi:hypothetical protein